MPNTTWKINVPVTGSKGAKALARDLRDLDAVCVALGKSSGVLKSIASDAGAIRGARVRIRAERAVGEETMRQQKRSAAAFDANGNVRRAVVRRQEREQREATRAEVADQRERRTIGEGIARESARLDRAAARERARTTTQRRRDDEGIARASQRADRDDARTAARTDRTNIAAGQRMARLNSQAYARDQRDMQRSERTQQRGNERTARLNSRAYERDQRLMERNSRRQQREAVQTARVQTREAKRVEQEKRNGWKTVLDAGKTTLGISTAISAATIGAISAIADLIGGVGQLVLGISIAVLRMIAFRESTLTTLRVMARDSNGRRLTGAAANAQAHEQFGFAQRFARETPLDTRQVLDLQRQTTAAGFHGGQNRQVLMAAADVGALRGEDDPSAARRYLLQLGQMRGATSMRTRDFRPAAEAAGLQENDVLRATARESRMATAQQRRGESETAYNGRLQGMLSHGGFTGEQGVAGFLAAQRERNGGAEGSFARSQSGGLAATLSNLGGAIEDFVTSVDDIENLPGIVALKGTLNGVVDALVGTGPVATRLRTTFTSIVDEVAQFAADLGGSNGGAEGILTRVLDTAERLYPFVRDITMAFGGAAWDSFKEGLAPLLVELGKVGDDPSGTVGYFRVLGSCLGDLLAYGVKITVAFAAFVSVLTILADALRWVIELIPRAVNGLGSVFGGIGGVFNSIGTSVVHGFQGGFLGSAPAAVNDVANWSNDIERTSRDELMVQSPSRVFRDIGRQIPAGMSLGIDSGARDVERSLSSMVAPPSLGGFGAAGMAGFGGGISAVFNITVEAGAHANDTGRELGDAAWEQFVDRFEGVMAMGGG